MARRAAVIALLAASACLSPPSKGGDEGDPPDGGGVVSSGGSLRLFGSPFEQDGLDRLWIPAGAGTPAGELGSSTFTLELWIKVEEGAIAEADCVETEWWRNHLLLDREFLMDPPQDGNIGLAVWRAGAGSGVAFGFQVGDEEANLCGNVPVADGAWHHVAAVRYPTTDQLVLYVDGVPDVSKVGPSGDGAIAKDADGETADLFMVLGGNKHGEVVEVNHNFAGWVDDLRLSGEAIYTDTFDPPDAPLQVDAQTSALYRFDEGDGTTASNAADPGNGDGELRVGGPSMGPTWSDETPY